MNFKLMRLSSGLWILTGSNGLQSFSKDLSKIYAYLRFRGYGKSKDNIVYATLE